MKKLFLLMLGIFLSILICSAQKVSKDLQEFAMDFSSTNVKIRGELMLFGKYKNNLSSLTYELYIEMLKKSELKSNKGIAKTVSKVEDKYFQSEPKTFVIVIYSKKWNAIICDDANTAFVDSIKLLSPNEKVPDLKRFVKK